jgi:hypothetical protein
LQQNQSFVDHMAAMHISDISGELPECMPDPEAFTSQADGNYASTSRIIVPTSPKAQAQPLPKSTPAEAKRRRHKEVHKLAQTNARKRPRLRVQLVRDFPRQQVIIRPDAMPARTI